MSTDDSRDDIRPEQPNGEGQPSGQGQTYGQGQPHQYASDRYQQAPGQAPGQQGGAWSNPAASIPAPSRETARTWAILCHLSLIISAVLSTGVLAFVGPLIFWFLYKDKDALVRNAAAGAFNFAVTLGIASVVAWLLAATVILIPVSLVLWAAIFVCGLVFSILGAMAASRYEMYRYPLTLQLLS